MTKKGQSYVGLRQEYFLEFPAHLCSHIPHALLPGGDVVEKEEPGLWC